MCFPTLFPMGTFGKHHHRKVDLSHSEYIKSRLLNKNSQFRKVHITSSVCYGRKKCMSYRQESTICWRIGFVCWSPDEHLEANLCTILQSERGRKQYWYTRQSEVRTPLSDHQMIREWGSPTLFVTLSCAEYECPEIEKYLSTCKVNINAPPNYPIGRLCTEDPISVSRKFALKIKIFLY